MEAARDHGKSFVFSYAWPLFNIQKIKEGMQPENIALISYSEDQAKKNLARVRKAIDSKHELNWLYPKSKAYVWESSMLNMSNDCTLETFGFGSSVRGGHYHRIIVDDPTKDHFSMDLDEQENFFFGVIIPALRKGGQLVVTGNPVAKKDLLAKLESNAEFKTFFYPALNSLDEPLWPEQYAKEDIEARRRQIPIHIFLREYMLKRVSAADAKFKQDWIHYYESKDLEKKALYKIMTIDPAISPGGDALAAVVTGTDTKDNTFVLERMAFRGQFQQGIDLLCDLMQRHSPQEIGFETFSFQKMYKIWLEDAMKRRDIYFYIKEIGRDSKKTKAMRIEALQPKLAQGKLFFTKEQHSLVDQLLLWDPLSRNNDDDEIDALAYQVGMWRRPYDTEDENGYANPNSSDIKPGTFAAALQEMTEGKQSGYISKLFEDFK